MRTRWRKRRRWRRKRRRNRRRTNPSRKRRTWREMRPFPSLTSAAAVVVFASCLSSLPSPLLRLASQRQRPHPWRYRRRSKTRTKFDTPPSLRASSPFAVRATWTVLPPSLPLSLPLLLVVYRVVLSTTPIWPSLGPQAHAVSDSGSGALPLPPPLPHPLLRLPRW